MKLDENKVVVGLSGGVDSGTAAYLLKRQGYEVMGVTMLLFDEYNENGEVILPEFINDAKKVADKLGIKHYVADFRSDFQAIVKTQFIDEYLCGRTPNPCVICNRTIKYGKLLEFAHNLGAYYIATGHYADIQYDKNIKRYRLFRGKAEHKDQGYFLHSLSQRQLKHILLPLGNFSSKEEVRNIAKEINPQISKKKDSIGICFIKDDDYPGYLKKHSSIEIREGDFVDIHGQVIGKHKGIVNYTIGQRRGLGEYFNKPMFVIEINLEKNQVVLGRDEDTYSIGLIAKNPNFIPFEKLQDSIKVDAKICNWGWFLPATVSNLEDGRIKVIFEKKERAIAPGQAVVFYNGNEVVGGATIESALK